MGKDIKSIIIKVLEDNTMGADDGYGGIIKFVCSDDYEDVAQDIVYFTGIWAIKRLLKEARDLLIMCSLMDKSNQCKEIVNHINEMI